MKVYLLFQHADGEPDEVYDVYATQELVEKRFAEIVDRYDKPRLTPFSHGGGGDGMWMTSQDYSDFEAWHWEEREVLDKFESDKYPEGDIYENGIEDEGEDE